MGAWARKDHRRPPTLAALCAALALGAAASPAQAERFAFAAGYDTVNNGDVCTPTHVCQPGIPGVGAAQLALPVGAAVMGGHVFVAEAFANRVSVHDATTGAFLFAFGKHVGGHGTSTCTTKCGMGAVVVCKNGEEFPFPGCPHDELTIPRDTVLQPFAVTAVDGQLFIGENGNRVSVWEPDGTFVRAFGRGVGGPGVDSCTTECFHVNGGENDAGELWAPASVAVTNGEAFVTDANDRVSVFDATTGSFKRAYGKDVGGDGMHVCTTTCLPGGAGGGGGSGPLDFPGVLAASGGQLYVADMEHHRVAVHDAATGAFVRAIGSGMGTGAGQLLVPSSLAIAGGELFVGELANGRVSVFDAATGTFLRAVGRDVGGAGVPVCTSSCQAGTSDETGAGFQLPSAIAVAGGRAFVPEGLGGTLTAIDAVSGAQLFIAGASVRSGGGNEFEICRFVCEPGRPGFGSGHLFGATGAAVAGGEVFVAETGNRISVFDAATGLFVRAFGKDVGGAGVHTCTSLCQIGTLGEGAGELSAPIGVAIVDGELFVSEQNNNRVSVFDAASGAFLRALGKDVGGDGIDVCTTTCRAGATGTAAGELDAPNGVAVGGGRVFVADYGNARMTVLDAATGDFVHAWGGGVDGAGGDVCTTTCQAGSEGVREGGELNNPTGVAFAGGEVFVAEDRNYRVSIFDAATGQFKRAYGKGVGGPGVNVCTASCTNGVQALLEASGAGGLVNPFMVTVADGQLYVADGFNHRVSVFDAASGEFLRAFGKDVGGPGIDTCTTTCQTASGLENTAGQIGFAFGVAVAPGGVFVTALLTPGRLSAFSSSADSTAPATTITSGPTGVIIDATPTFAFTSPDGSAVFECRVDRDSYRPCTSAHTTAALRDGEHTFSVRAVDPAWNADATPAERTFTVDAPPETTITAGPGGPTHDTTPTFVFESSEPGTFRCRVDGGSWRACTSPWTPAALTRGSHVFEVRATDQAGLTDPTPAKRTFVVDTTPPKVTITSGPGSTNDTTPSFGFASSEAGSTFECRVDTESFTPCTSPWATPDLAVGTHTLEVRAIDPAGNRGTAATRRFTIDQTPPQTTITSGPSGRTYDETPTFGFESSENGSTFECRVGDGAWRRCSSPHTTASLTSGPRTFEVRAIDAAGNVDPTPAVRAFTVVAGDA